MDRTFPLGHGDRLDRLGHPQLLSSLLVVLDYTRLAVPTRKKECIVSIPCFTQLENLLESASDHTRLVITHNRSLTRPQR